MVVVLMFLYSRGSKVCGGFCVRNTMTWMIVLYCIVKPGVMPGFYFINPKVEGYSIAQPSAAAQPKPRARVPICYQTPNTPNNRLPS